MSGAGAIPIGSYYHSITATHRLNTFTTNVIQSPNINSHEIQLLKGLANETPADFTGGTSEDISSTLNTDILIKNKSSDSNIAMTIELQPNTDIIYNSSDYNEAQNTSITNVNALYTKNVYLNDDTVPLYNGNIKFDYRDGDHVYSDIHGHHLILNTLHNDYNMHKAMNAVYSNTDSNATNGFRGFFNNDFNKNHAFYTESILRRKSDNSIEVDPNPPPGPDNEVWVPSDGISTSTGVPGNKHWEYLDVEILNSNNTDNVPLFGALKFFQDKLQISFPIPENNLTSDSTLSKLLNNIDLSTHTQQTATTQPDSSYEEEGFKDLFTPAYLAKVAPGYEYKMNIHPTPSDGYSLKNANIIKVPVYNTSNQAIIDDMGNFTTVASIFSIDNSVIEENARYMSDMKMNGYFNNDSHYLYVENGNLTKDPNHSNNLNFDSFKILNGVEKMAVTNNFDIHDLTRKGIIHVFDTNNITGDTYCRYKKFTDHSYTTETTDVTRVNKLVVTHSLLEPDARQDTGTLDQVFKDNYFVQSEITTLNSSTKTLSNADVWSPTIHTTKNAARANNSALVFQNTDNSNLFDSTNISQYEAAGLEAIMSDSQNSFCLVSVTKAIVWEDSDESPLFQTNNNQAIPNVVSNVSMTNINLNEIISQDIRVSINGKKANDFPTPSNEWAWAIGDGETGDIGSYNDSLNNGYIVSEKAGLDYLGHRVYDVLKLPPTDNIVVEFKLLTDIGPLPSKDILARKAEVTIKYGFPVQTIIENIEADDKDIRFFPISEHTDAGVVQSLEGLNQPNYYEVKKYITTKEYHVAIRHRIGPHKNLWIVKQVKEFTEWYQLTNQNKNGQIMPDYHLINIKDSLGLQVFKASRKFENGLDEVSSLSTIVNLKVKHLMGFTVAVEYDNGTIWKEFHLKPDTDYDYSLDSMYDKDTMVTLMHPNNPMLEFGTMKLTVDTSMFTSLGLSNHVSQIDNPRNAMYRINLGISRGSNSFRVKGYTYDVATDSTYFNNNVLWSPYSSGDDLFLKGMNPNGLNELKGTQMTHLSTYVDLIDPTPLDTINVNEVNNIRVTVKQGNISLFSFVSNKTIVENFNVIYMPKVIVQHNYYVDKLAYNSQNPLLSGTEYLASNYVLPNLEIINLQFGSNKRGIRVEVAPTSIINGTDASVRLSSSCFRLTGNIVKIKPLDETENTNVGNIYTGRYSHSSGEEITPSDTGFPLPTNSNNQRNIHSNIFRGFHNNQSTIDISRTMTKVKFVIGDKYVDDLNVLSDTNVSPVWTGRTQFNGFDARLRAMKMIKASNGVFTLSELENMNTSFVPSGSSIGTLGLIFNPHFSMLPESISPLYKIGINLTPSPYIKNVVNPLDPSINVTVISNLFDFNLHQFKEFSHVATRIMAYNEEKYHYTYSVPDLQISYSPQYIGNPKNFLDWSLIHTKTDSELRDGVVIGNQNYAGVVKFTKNIKFVSSFTKYCMSARPTAKFESYNVAELSGALPHGFSTKSYTKIIKHFDINITKSDNTQGLAASLQNHKPFDTRPLTEVPNQLNAVSENLGVNNVIVGVNVQKYLYLKEDLPEFSFTMTTNKLKISNGVGLTTAVTPDYTTIFDGYISQLSNSENWHEELKTNISNNFNDNKQWTLNFRQLTLPITMFLGLSPATLVDKNISLTGITSYGIGIYYLNLQTLDSLLLKLYKYSLVYDPILDTNKAVFNRYTTATITPGIAWNNTNNFSRSSMFKPILYTKDTYEMPLNITNTLTNTPYNVDDLIKHAITNTSNWGTWTPVSTFLPQRCPVSFTTLSSLGAASLLEILHVTKDHPLKVLTSTRPPILDVRKGDGSMAFRINHDGRLSSQNICTYKIELLESMDYTNTSPDNINSGLWFETHIRSNSEF